MTEILHFTEAAAEYIKGKLAKNQSHGFRVSIKETGCSGYSYAPTLINEALTGDLHFVIQEVNVYLDPLCVDYVKGLTVDYIEEKKAVVAVVRASMFKSDSIEVKRDCEATLIPSGSKVSVKAGSFVMVTQALGNSYTVYVNGNLVRIAGKDGDALGLVILDEPDINELPGTLEEKIETQLKTCYDPEIPVNIVDLGLIYERQILPLGRNEFGVEIKMTLTAPGCGMGPVLVNDIQEKLRAIKGITEVKVDLVFDPPWDREKMTEVARLQLGLM